MNDILKFEYRKGERQIFPCHTFVKSFLFTDAEEEEAAFAHHLAVVAEKNGMSNNDVLELFPAIMRILKSKSEWAK